MKKRKVLFVITKSNFGGAQRYVLDLAASLPSEVYDVVVSAGGDGILHELLKEKGIKTAPITTLENKTSLLKELRTFFTLAQIIKREKPDVLHVNSSKAGFIGCLLGRILRVPKIIFTAHGWAFNEDRSAFQKFCLKCIHWCTVLFSHTTIAVSHGLKKQMDWPLVEKKMRVVHLGRSNIPFKYRDEARGIIETKVTGNTARLSDYDADFWIGTIAELHPTKRLNRAIDSMSALTKTFPNLRFIIIHDGEERKNLEQQVEDLGLTEHVFFTGAIVEAARLLPAFDLFVLPSKSEAFGYVLIEAGLASLPVVATRVGGIPDIITDGENGLLVEPDNTPALTTALKKLIVDHELRHSIAQAHYARAETFTLSKMVQETMLLYI